MSKMKVGIIGSGNRSNTHWKAGEQPLTEIPSEKMPWIE